MKKGQKTKNYSTKPSSTSSSDGSEHNEAPIRERLLKFYSKYNPEKLDSIDTLLEHYEGREKVLLAKLIDKYGPEPR